MSYLLTQIWICLLLTALVAGLAGWLLGGTGKRKIRQLEEKWRADLARAENERDYYEGEVKNLKAIAEEQEEVEARFLHEKEALERELEDLKALKLSSVSAQNAEGGLAKRARELEEANNSLSAKFEQEQQFYTQRLTELEAGAEHDAQRMADYERRFSEMQSQLDEANIRLAETGNKLTETEAKLAMADSGDHSGLTGLSSAAAGAAAGVAGMVMASDELDADGENYPIDAIEAISNETGRRLRKLGIKTTADLLKKTSDKENIALLAKSMGKEGWVVRSWASVADLMRVKGIDAVNAELLELSGVSTVQSLLRSKAEKLADSVKVIHRHVGKSTHLPSVEEINGWINNAAQLEPVLESNVEKI